MKRPITVAIAGHGKIAHDQHVPALAADSDYELVAVVDPSPDARMGSPAPHHFPDLAALLASGLAVDAVAMCQPPQARFDAARRALDAGLHVLLEKPPGATPAEVQLLREAAAARSATLYCSWHSRHAAGVAPAVSWLASRTVRRARIVWKEDVRFWHPGQEWVWASGGMGVFDPGINALSIATLLLGSTLRVCQGNLDFPANRQTPVAGEMLLQTGQGAEVQVSLDWLEPGAPCWDIEVETDDGTLRLREGGARLWIDGREAELARVSEYASMYAHFAALVRAGASDADDAPLRIVADAFLRCGRRAVDAFHWEGPVSDRRGFSARRPAPRSCDR